MSTTRFNSSGWILVPLTFTFFGGIALAGRIATLTAAEWSDKPNLPYSSTLTMVPLVLGFLAGFGIWVGFYWWLQGREPKVSSSLFAWLVSSVGGVAFCSGFVLLCSLTPPWPGLMQANRAAHFCINKLNVDWCEHLIKNFPAAIPRLPSVYSLAFEGVPSSDALKSRLEWARLDPSRRAMVEEYRTAAQKFQAESRHDLAIAEIRKVFAIVPSDDLSRNVERVSLAALKEQREKALAIMVPSRTSGEYHRKGISILEAQLNDLIRKKQWNEAREVWANIQILDPENKNLSAWASVLSRARAPAAAR